MKTFHDLHFVNIVSGLPFKEIRLLEKLLLMMLELSHDELREKGESPQ